RYAPAAWCTGARVSERLFGSVSLGTSLWERLFGNVSLGTSLWERLFGNVSYGRPIIALERQLTAIRMGGSRRWRAVEAGLFQMPGNCKGERATATAGLAGVGALAAAGASGSGPSRTFGRGAQ